MARAKTVAETVDVPEGLDIIPTVPGTFVGGHDVQGADGKARTDRPGAILGTPVINESMNDHIMAARDKETAKHDYVREAVDRNNREVLPKLGGAIDDPWEPDGEAKVELPAGIEDTEK